MAAKAEAATVEYCLKLVDLYYSVMNQSPENLHRFVVLHTSAIHLVCVLLLIFKTWESFLN